MKNLEAVDLVVVASFLCGMMNLEMVDLMVVALSKKINEISIMNLEMVGLLVVALLGRSTLGR